MSDDPTLTVHKLMPLTATLGFTVERWDPDEVRMSVAWSPGLCTAASLLHGGVIMALADSAGASCAFLNLSDGAGTTTIESKTHFLRAVREGTAVATARPLHLGRSLIVVETEVSDAGGRLVAKVTQSQMLLRPEGG